MVGALVVKMRRLGSAMFLLALASALGAVVSLIAVAFIEGSSWLFAQGIGSGKLPWWLVLLMPAAAGFLSAQLCARTGNKVASGPADVMFAKFEGLSKLSLRDGALNGLASFCALALGGSVGVYGPIVHLGSTVAVHLSRWLGDRAIQIGLGCGCAAAIAAAFNAPLAGMVFAHEVIIKHYSLRIFAPVAASALAANWVSRHLLDHGSFLEFGFMDNLAFDTLLQFAVVGLACGFVACAIIKGCLGLVRWYRGFLVAPWMFPTVGGLLAGLLAVSLGVPQILGSGKPLIEMLTTGAVIGSGTVVLILLAKLAATYACIGFGMAGGLFSPSLAIGAAAGHCMGLLLAALLPAELMAPVFAYALVGMFSTGASVIGAPLAGILIAVEFSGSYPLAIAVAIAILIASLTVTILIGGDYYRLQLAEKGVSPWAGAEERVMSRIKVSSRMHYAGADELSRLAGARSVAASDSLWDALGVAEGANGERLVVVDEKGNAVGMLVLEEVLLELAHLNRKFRTEEGDR